MLNTPPITLRPTRVTDLETLFTFQLDPEANYMAAFTSKDPTDKTAYLQKFTKLLQDPGINNQTILAGEVVAGSIAKFVMEGRAEITYWLDRRFWGRGIATAALERFLAIERTRPLFARAAFDNVGSQRVLEKCGFTRTGRDKGFANARQAETEEYIYTLTA
jgi:RimJ/RimL family protein N-acetyltransferase